MLLFIISYKHSLNLFKFFDENSDDTKRKALRITDDLFFRVVLILYDNAKIYFLK